MFSIDCLIKSIVLKSVHLCQAYLCHYDDVCLDVDAHMYHKNV